MRSAITVLRKMWEYAKKVPYYAYVAIVMVAAFAYVQWRRYRLAHEKNDLVIKMVDAEVERGDVIRAIDQNEEAEIEMVNRSFDRRIETLEKKKDEINRRINEGTATVASEWMEYMRNRDEK